MGLGLGLGLGVGFGLGLDLCGIREAAVAGSVCFQVPLASAVAVILCSPSMTVVTTVPAATKPQTTASLGLACRTMWVAVHVGGVGGVGGRGWPCMVLHVWPWVGGVGDRAGPRG